MKDKEERKLTIDEVKEYWGEKNIPQQWYSKKEPFTLSWYNELAFKRYDRYYPHLKTESEFEYHSGEDVLEVGCGIGTDLAEFAKGGAVVTGVDLGEDQVKLSKLNFDLRGLPYKEFRVANVEALPFPDKSFDLVYCIGVIHHTPNTEKAVSEIHRVLKKDGKAIVLVYARGWKHYIKRCFIHGILEGKIFKYKFSWQKVYNETSEVYGSSPKTAVYTKKQVTELFSEFPTVELGKYRMGEFFEYKPYNTYKFPKFVNNFMNLSNLEGFMGENRIVKAQKSKFPKEAKLWEVLFKHY
tara:strand:- start:1153 stop:2043 length:891 start_codon:yes stop_codon:yes gene_type:complete